MKRILNLLFLCITICFCFTGKVYAAEKDEAEKAAQDFKEYIVANDEEYSDWKDADLEFAYDLYSMDCEKILCKLFYVERAEYKGYVIVDCSDNTVLEFSLGRPAFDLVNTSEIIEVKYIYENAMPVLLGDGKYYNIYGNGDMIPISDITPCYYPNEQGNSNCIVAAISNLMWHYGKNGYSSLINGMTFDGVKNKVDNLINAEGGYQNKNIPNTIKKYVKNKSSYSVSVTNKWNPTFNNVKTETNNRPCLLGFAAGKGSYSTSVGHMTVCVGTRTANKINYVKVMDGWSTSITEKKWGTYNDFISKVTMSK